MGMHKVFMFVNSLCCAEVVGGGSGMISKRRNHVTSKSNAPDTDKSRVAIGVVWKAKTAARC